jgi:CRP/FNR family transcriptional regulator
MDIKESRASEADAGALLAALGGGRPATEVILNTSSNAPSGACSAGVAEGTPAPVLFPARHGELGHCEQCWLGRACPNAPSTWVGTTTRGEGHTRELERGDHLYRKGKPFHALYIVLDGSLKSVASSYEGQEKIVAFHLPWEMFGLCGLPSGQYAYDTIALEPTRVCAVPYANLLSHLRHDERLHRTFSRVLTCAAARHRGLAGMLGDLSSERRVAAALLDLSCRYARSGHPPQRFPFVMTRVDFANYTGLAHETVSRVVSHFSANGLIHLEGRLIAISGLAAMERLADLGQIEHCDCAFFGC